MASILVSPRRADTKKDNLRCSRGDRRRCAGGASFNPPVWLLRCECQPAESQVSGLHPATLACTVAQLLRRAQGAPRRTQEAGGKDSLGACLCASGCRGEAFAGLRQMAHEGRALCSCCPDLDREDCEAFAVYDAAGNDSHTQLRHQGLREDDCDRSCVKYGTRQRRFAWHLRKDDCFA